MKKGQKEETIIRSFVEQSSELNKEGKTPEAGDKNEVYDRITVLHAAELALRGD